MGRTRAPVPAVALAFETCAAGHWAWGRWGLEMTVVRAKDRGSEQPGSHFGVRFLRVPGLALGEALWAGAGPSASSGQGLGNGPHGVAGGATELL